MRVIATLTWRLLLGSGGRGALTTALSTLAVAIATALLLLTVGIALGFNERANREAWLLPQEATGNPTAMMAVTTDFVRGTPIAIVDVAALSSAAPAPPGLSQFPEPGEVWVSPVLGSLISDLSDDELADRFGQITGEIEPDALVHPDQLMVITGRDQAYLDDRSISAIWTEPYWSPPVAVSDFSGTEPAWAVVYRALSAFATALLVVPLVVLGTAAGRLSTSHRDRRLAAMRLVGATPGQVLSMTVLETVLIGVAGALIGALTYVATLPLTAQVSATGGRWFITDLWVGADVVLLALFAVPAIVGVSALLGLRRLVISPLGVARKQQPAIASFWRLPLFIVLIVIYAVLAPGIQRAEGVLFATFFGMLFLAVSILGPFIVRVLGYAMALLARKPATLLAGRRILDDPQSVWRIVGGVTLAGFVAGFLMIIIPQNASTQEDGAHWLEIAVPESRAPAIILDVRRTTAEAGINASVEVNTDTFWPTEESRDASFSRMSVQVSGNQRDLDRARTILWQSTGQTSPVSSSAMSWFSNAQLQDIQTAGVLVLTVTLAVACASAMITGVAGILDRRQTLGLLRLAGTPLEVLDSARLRETIAPFVILGAGAVAAGMFCALPLAASAGVGSAERSWSMLLIPVAVTIVGLTLAEIASRITLRAATADPTAHR